jgi:carboxypeptidase Taq
MSDNIKLEAVGEPAVGYNDLKYYFSNLNTLFSIRGTLAMDMMTSMPAGGLQRRLNDITSLTKRIYAETTTSAVTGLLEKVQRSADSDPEAWSDWDLANLREMQRIHSHLAALPPDLYSASVMIANEGRKRHTQALKNGNWKDISPGLQQTVDLYRKIAELKYQKFGTQNPYEALLIGYASDISEAKVNNLYDSLLPSLKELHQKALKKQENQEPPKELEGNFSRGDQMWLNQTVLQMMGFDFNRGTLSVSNLSPMAGGTPDDVRVLVRCNDQTNFLDSLEDTLYQGAKALYIQNLPQNWKSQPVGQDLGSMMSIAISMLYETIIGRTPQFFDFIAVRAEGVFRSFRNASFETENLYRLKKVIRTTPMRNEADEMSKIFHDILRFRIERDLINGTLAVKDLPERWKAESKELLGVEPKTLAEGPLQNPDWFTGRFGFIATNTLSHIVAAELHEKLYQDIDDLPGVIERGELGQIKNSLDKTIFSKGRSIDAMDLLRDASGQELSVKPLLTHLERRYLSDKR